MGWLAAWVVGDPPQLMDWCVWHWEGDSVIFSSFCFSASKCGVLVQFSDVSVGTLLIFIYLLFIGTLRYLI